MSKIEVDAIEPQSGTTLTLGASGDSVNIASGATITDFTSTGIDDNATSNAITIESTERVQFTRPRSNTLGDSALEIQPSDTVIGYGFRIDSSTNSFIIEKSSPSGSEAERMRIDSSGRLLLGTTSSTGVAGTGMGITSGVSGGTDGALHLKGGSGDFTAFTFHNNPVYINSVVSAATDQLRITSSTNGTIMALLDDGRINAPLVYNDTVTGRDLYIASNGQIGYLSSTRDSKTNIENILDVSWLYQLNPVSFNYKVQDEQGNYTEEAKADKFYGLIAEEVETVNPDICFYKNDNPEDGLAGVDYKKLYAPMIKALQEQQTKIEELEARITALENA